MKSVQTRELIKIKCNEVINRKKDNLEYIGTNAPYGYILDKSSNQLKIDKKCSHVIYTIFDLYDKGYGFTTIADYLNERGIVAPTTYKKTGEYIKYYDDNMPLLWKKSSVRKIINNKVYNGSYLYTDKITHEAIICDEMWASVQRRNTIVKSNSAHDFFDKNGNEFCGKVFCSICGLPLTLETSRCKDGYVNYLRCSSYDRRGKHKLSCENRLAIRYDDLKDVVSFFIEQNIFDKINIEHSQSEFVKILKNSNIDIKRHYLKQEKKELNILINKYLEYLDSFENNDLYNKILKEDYNKRIINYKLRLCEIENMLNELYSIGRLKLLSNKELFLDKFIIDNFVERIEVGSLVNNQRNINIALN